MTRRAILHSWHSQVVPTIAKELESKSISALVSIDSHLDLYMITQEELELYPTDLLELAACRAAAHFQLRYVLSDGKSIWTMNEKERRLQPSMLVVAPIGESLAKEAAVSASLRQHGMRGLSLAPSDLAEATAELLGISIYSSPPKELWNLLPQIRHDDIIFDIDVDYFHEMQTECYSPRTNVKPGDLGHLPQTLRLIAEAKPPVITISEAKVTSRRDPRSGFNQFIESLKRIGYTIEESELFDDDTEPQKSMQLFEEYWHAVREPLLAQFSDPFAPLNPEYGILVKRETIRFFAEKLVP